MHGDDESLVENFRRTRTPNSFKALVQRYQLQLYNVAYRLIGNHEESEEMVQETFLRAYKYFDRLRCSSSFYGWVLGIIGNLCCDLLRGRSIHRRRMHALTQEYRQSMVAETAQRDDPLYRLEEQEQSMMVEKSLARLPIDQRAVLVLRDIEGLPYKRIADITGSKPGTVRSRLHYARLKLRIMLMPYVEGETNCDCKPVMALHMVQVSGRK